MTRDFALSTVHGTLRGPLALPPASRGLILVAGVQELPDVAGNPAAPDLGALSMPLLTEEETHFPDSAYNVPLLARRLLELLDRLRLDGDTESLPLGIFAAGPAAPAALRVAARRDAQVRAVVCHGGLIDQAGLESLRLLAAPLLVLADEDDSPCQASFRRAAGHLSPPHRLVVLPAGARPADPAARWFGEYLPAI